MYKVGQAVILENDSLLFAKLSGFENILGQDCVMSDSAYYYSRPATEAEILDQAVKHGWTAHNIINIDSPSADVYLQRDYANSPWKISHAGFIEDYSVFGQECITAHRLITALNLAK